MVELEKTDICKDGKFHNMTFGSKSMEISEIFSLNEIGIRDGRYVRTEAFDEKTGLRIWQNDQYFQTPDLFRRQ